MPSLYQDAIVAKFGTVEVAVDVKHDLVLGTTPDGHLEVWLLYRPEPFPVGDISEREINLWVRRADVFTSRERAVAHLNTLLGETVPWRPYDPIFPELWIGYSRAGYRWLMCPAPVDAMVPA